MIEFDGVRNVWLLSHLERNLPMLRSALLVSLLTASFAFAGYTQDGTGSATFDAKGTLGLKIHGTASKLTVTDDGKNLSVTVKIADVDTDNSLRNKHLGEDMEAATYPDITLTVPLDGLKLEGGSGTAKGTFAIHGKTREVSFKYATTVKDGLTAIEGSADLNLSDYGVKIRNYLGVTVKPDITVAAKFALKK